MDNLLYNMQLAMQALCVFANALCGWLPVGRCTSNQWDDTPCRPIFQMQSVCLQCKSDELCFTDAGDLAFWRDRLEGGSRHGLFLLLGQARAFTCCLCKWAQGCTVWLSRPCALGGASVHSAC